MRLEVNICDPKMFPDHRPVALPLKERLYGSDYDKTLLRFMIYSGVRISEAFTLNWNDIDFQNNIIIINKTLSQIKHGYKISDPKTSTS